MTLVCETCGRSFSDRQVILGKERHLHGRKQCLACRPFQPRRSPSFVQQHESKQLRCESCGKRFPAKQVINGKMRSLYRRRFCLDCSPFGAHNTSRTAPGKLTPDELREYRRKRRNAKTYRYLKKRRRRTKLDLIEARGGRCEICGYGGTPAALDFHHRDAASKCFSLSTFDGPWAQLLAEAAKCDLLCANCHLIRNALEDLNAKGGPVVEFRRAAKVRAVEHMGSVCYACHQAGPPVIFAFHHLDPGEKAFGISDGVPRRWERVVAELEKCVMLCANCHREAHAGVLDLDEGVAALDEHEQDVA